MGAIPSLFQGAVGLGQLIGGNRQLRNLKRPEYNIPGESFNQLALNQQAYADPYSVGELRAQNNIGLSGANAVAAARDSGNLSAMAPAIAAQQNAGYNTLQTQVEGDRERRRQALMQSLDMMAAQRDKAWQLNEYAPYADKYAEARQRIGAGQENIMGALGGLSSVGQLYAASRQDNSINPQQAASVSSNVTNNAANGQNAVDIIVNAIQKYGQQAYPYYSQFGTAMRKI